MQEKEISVVHGVSETQEPNLIDKINEMKALGLTNTKEFSEKMRQLEVVLGIPQINPFGTTERKVFEDKLLEMTYADMQKMASKIGVNPYQHHKRLKDSLLREFSSYNKNNTRNILPTHSETFQIDLSNPDHAKLDKILRDI